MQLTIPWLILRVLRVHFQRKINFHFSKVWFFRRRCGLLFIIKATLACKTQYFWATTHEFESRCPFQLGSSHPNHRGFSKAWLGVQWCGLSDCKNFGHRAMPKKIHCKTIWRRKLQRKSHEKKTRSKATMQWTNAPLSSSLEPVVFLRLLSSGELVVAIRLQRCNSFAFQALPTRDKV